MKIYSIYDSKLEAYLTPFFTTTAGMAIRMFQSAAMDADHEFHRHGADFTLFEIGEFDDNKGEVTNHAANKNLGNALDALTQSNIQGDGGNGTQPPTFKQQYPNHPSNQENA